MKRTRILAVAALATALSIPIDDVRAETSSCSHIQRENLIRCALDGSLTAKVEHRHLDAAEARRKAAQTVLPANPVLDVAVARRNAIGNAPVVNWYVTLSQEIEIGGQRSARMQAADAERDAQEKTVTKTDREVAAHAWRAYFEALAAREALRLAERIESLTAKVATATRAAADKGVVSGIDADVAEATLLRATQDRLIAERNAQITLASLSALMMHTSGNAIAVAGELLPLSQVESFAAGEEAKRIDESPEVQALEATGRAYEARASLLRRSRIPNPTLGLFLQDDGFHERVVGGQISLPLPLPHPVGRTNAGEIAEADALTSRAKTDIEKMRRDMRLHLRHAQASFVAARAQAALHTPERLQRTNESLQAIASEIEAGRLAIRDAIVAERALVDILNSSLESRKNLALASVDLALAAGYPLEQGAP